ncbi:methyltransferase domain-containing protein [Rhodobacterales bacterium FZCC0069]|nr:methyltransferase domain-containing protein [Rhodobacterales bacterium FZCC0069]
MIDLLKFVPSTVLQHLSASEKKYLTEVFDLFDGYPSIEQMWALMDQSWVELKCDPFDIDERINCFYRHPVWLLNGLFVEAHEQSIENRKVIADWVICQQPTRVADFGGGFGGLARMIGAVSPNTQIEVVDPHPHPAAIALANKTRNVRFVPELTGKYDILIATDVFEHVPDPIGLVSETAESLYVGGQYLIANCFAPVILCHLPQLFHFNTSWDTIMRTMGLEPSASVSYGRAYEKKGELDVLSARKVAKCSARIYRWISWLPRGRSHVGRLLLAALSKCNAI